MSSMEARRIGSIWSIWHNKLTTDRFRYSGIGKMPDLIFLNSDGTCSSSKGRVPHSKAYRITPQDQISTSGPAYNLPDITCKIRLISSIVNLNKRGKSNQEIELNK